MEVNSLINYPCNATKRHNTHGLSSYEILCMSVMSGKLSQVGTLVPSLFEAITSYESVFGSDPLAGHHELLREHQISMDENLPSPEDLFSHVVNDFFQSLQFMIDKTIPITSSDLIFSGKDKGSMISCDWECSIPIGLIVLCGVIIYIIFFDTCTYQYILCCNIRTIFQSQ